MFPRQDRPTGVSLDEPPPSPPTKKPAAKSLTSAEREREEPGEGMGEMANTPQARALKGLMSIEKGVQDLVIVFPDIAAQLGDFMNQLRPVVVNGLANLSMGGGAAAPGGMMMPPAPPPPPMAGPPMGAPPQPGM